MFSCMMKVLVGREQGQFVMDAELNEQSINGAQLYARATASVVDLSSSDVIMSIRPNKGQGFKVSDNRVSCLRA